MKKIIKKIKSLIIYIKSKFLLRQGNKSINSLQYRSALKKYNKAIKLNNNNANLYNERGFIYSKLEQYQEAINNFDQAIKINDKFLIAYQERGLAKLALQQYQEAINDFNTAITLTPDSIINLSALNYFYRGFAKGYLQQFRESNIDFKTAIKLSPNNSYIFFRIGMAHAELKQYKTALAFLNKSFTLVPQKFFIELLYFYTGLTLYHLEQYQDAIDNLDTSIRLNVECAESYFNRGLAKQKLNIDSENDFKIAKKLNPMMFA